MIQKATLPAITGRITAMAPMAPRVLGTWLRHVPQKRLLVPWQLRSTSQAVNVNANLRQIMSNYHDCMEMVCISTYGEFGDGL